MLGPTSGWTSSNCISPCQAKRVAQRELDLLAVVAHLLEQRRLEPVRRPGADAQAARPNRRTASSRSSTTIAHCLKGGSRNGDGLLGSSCGSASLVDEPDGLVDRILGTAEIVPSATSAIRTQPPRARDSATAHTPATARSPAAPVDLRRARPSRTAATKSSSSMAIVAASTSAKGRSYSVPSGPNNRAATPCELEATKLPREARRRSACARRAGRRRRRRCGRAGRSSTRRGRARCAGSIGARARTAGRQSWISTPARRLVRGRRASPRPSLASRRADLLDASRRRRTRRASPGTARR